MENNTYLLKVYFDFAKQVAVFIDNIYKNYNWVFQCNFLQNKSFIKVQNIVKKIQKEPDIISLFHSFLLLLKNWTNPKIWCISSCKSLHGWLTTYFIQTLNHRSETDWIKGKYYRKMYLTNSNVSTIFCCIC